ncbi:hypothetical protein C0991_012431, partial [Blastosporella zonata]
DNNDGYRVHPFQRDPRNPVAIEESYKRLESRVTGLEKELDDLISDCRKLGRSFALSDATRTLRVALDELRAMFSENAIFLRTQGMHPIDLRGAAWYFEQLADGCDKFQERLNEFTDTYRATSLDEHVPHDLFKSIEPHQIESISLYIHDLSGEMENDLKDLTDAFRLFNTHGIPSLQYEEQRETDILISVSTVGSLLSAVTVTALQISLADNGSLASIVNSFWFASLVFSIGAALNSLLSVIWKRTP